ncbi:hypothetical protein HEB94_004290 [Actinopolymorpha pittospori]|uniref:Uncharacterized protein n=1 Tax=Actinopolymorpha pittospori TaxID=648752 RepID=A0A927R952_9ACTN|nr:hypothetical protein [Actinopolymorpha pittospori]
MASRDHLVGAANRSIPLVANLLATECCSASRKLITMLSVAAIVGQLDAAVDSANDTSGGFSETEASEVAVKPAGPDPASAVTTTTPAA